MSEFFEGYKIYEDKEADVADIVLRDGDLEDMKVREFRKVTRPDAVNSPPHYTQGVVEVIDYIEQVSDSYEGKNAYLAGNIIKYVSRAPHKNGAEDIRKAIWYAKRLANSMEREGMDEE